jgi:plastocyanin
MVRKLCLLVAALAVAAALAVPAFAATKTVKIGDYFFVKKGSPPTVTVKRGTTVKWVWTGKVMHNVTVLSGPAKFHSKLQAKGSYSEKLSKKGTYKIVCTIHKALGQRMTLKVV